MADSRVQVRRAPVAQAEMVRLIVERGLATQAEVNRCVALVRDAAPGDRRASLPRVLVGEGVVTASQMARLVRALEAPGGHIPGYRMICRLGAGSMATVFKARQLSLDRVVAIKVLSRRLSENAEYVGRFYREGKAAARLNHPNIVQAIDVGEANGYHYFVMEYVEGHTLHDELVAGKVFSEAQALAVVIQIARALEHAHAQGLIHRDVKPKNVMIASDGRAKLADMGLARAVSDASAARAEAGKAFGTPFYISPEQIRGDVGIDFRADIYSLGATLYHLVTGRVPFYADSPLAVMHKHLYERLVPPDHVNPGLSAGLGEVVEVMMAREPAQRYASTSDLLVDLESVSSGGLPLQAHQQIDADVLTSLASGDEAAERAAPRRQRLGLALLVVSLVLAASLVLNVLLLVWG